MRRLPSLGWGRGSSMRRLAISSEAISPEKIPGRHLFFPFELQFGYADVTVGCGKAQIGFAVGVVGAGDGGDAGGWERLFFGPEDLQHLAIELRERRGKGRQAADQV